MQAAFREGRQGRKESSGAGVNYTLVFADGFGGSWAKRGVTISTTPFDAEFERVKVHESTGNLPQAFGTVRVAPIRP